VPEALMPEERHVKLFRNGRNQAVRIPREFELPGDEAVMRKEGDRLIVKPLRRKSLLEVLKTLKPIEEDFPEIDDPPPERAQKGGLAAPEK
jgi:antitoxin VapB